MSFAKVVTFLRSLFRKRAEITAQPNRCESCVREKVYRHMCSDNKSDGLLINGSAQEEVQIKSIEALKCPKRWKKQKTILSTLDILISLFVVTPLVVACWRGTWDLMDIYADYFPPWESFIIGTFIHIIIGITQESFHEILNKKHESWMLNALSVFLMKLYTVVLNAVTNLHWRGAWVIVDKLFGITLTETGKIEVENGIGTLAFFSACFLIMFFMKCLRNLNSPPFEICLDYGDDMFLFPNMFKVKVSEKMSLYILDVIFSMAVVTNLGVLVWRGFWLLVDLYLFPDDQILSSWASLFLGYLMVGIIFLLQSQMKKLCDNLSGIPKLLVADSYMIFSVMGVIIVWRGIWNLIDIYFLPEYSELSCWICHWISLLILILMGCSNSVLVRGICLDCEEPDGTCVVFPCSYLKVIFMEEKYETWFSILASKKKKLKKQSEKCKLDLINYHVVSIKEDISNNNNNNNDSNNNSNNSGNVSNNNNNINLI